MSKRPNIVFILIDDMGWMDLACQGSSFYETPNLDRLAGQGMRFTNAYAACPVCSPTRASLMTGKYPATVGITEWIGGASRGRLLPAPYLHHLPQEEHSVAAALRDGGYQTWHVGKWHLGEQPYWPEHCGFDVNIGGWQRGSPKTYFSPYEMPNLSDGPNGEYLTDRLTDEAIRLIRNSDGRPFFLNLWHYAVHTPIQTPESYTRRFARKAADLGLDQRDPFEIGEQFPIEHKRDKRVIRRLFQSDPAYAGMIYNLDENIGRLLATLDELKIADETIVIFTSDNGGLATSESSPTCNAPLCEGKGWMYEGGTREPLLVRWPGVVAPSSTCHVPVTSPDFYPTLLEAAGLPLRPRQHTDGASIVPLLRGGQRIDRDAIFWHYPHYGNQGGTPGCSVRCGDYKLIEFFEDNRVELYNLANDISETSDLANDRPEVARELHRRLHDWQCRVGAKLPSVNPEWTP